MLHVILQISLIGEENLPISLIFGYKYWQLWTSYLTKSVICDCTITLCLMVADKMSLSRSSGRAVVESMSCGVEIPGSGWLGLGLLHLLLNMLHLFYKYSI